ncbi:ferritin-like domain-containing protein [Ottowia flava]|uniref:Ferritin-like domain-containing protein n=1 Tax=Ottowia flava TaxID=2675430 RepID=A0ABW4KUB5_9BURK|nr:ferritin-like domain-containing protein [Ottowia sp. GY511]
MNRLSTTSWAAAPRARAARSADGSSTTQDLPPSIRWRLEDIDLSAIDHARIADNEALFYLLVSASFIESGSDLYTRNLVDHYADHPPIAVWLRDHWEHEELQHGRAFAAYVQAAWPEFPWQTAFNSFIAEYGALCTTEALEDDRTLELAARCVVETGTTSYYQTLRTFSDEPVLQTLLGHIRADEVSHYKHFLAYFKQLRAARPVARWRVARVLARRLQEIRESDSDIALRHVWAHKGRLFPHHAARVEDVAARLYPLVSDRLPAQQAVRMLLKPMALPHWLEARLERPLAALARRVLDA